MLTSIATQGLGLIDEQVAARLEPDLALESRLDLRFDVEALEERTLLMVELDLADQLRVHLIEKLDDPLVGLLAVDPQHGVLVVEEIANDS